MHVLQARIVDHSGDKRALEGTGSIVFDYLDKKAYACRSERTDEGLLQEVKKPWKKTFCTSRYARM